MFMTADKQTEAEIAQHRTSTFDVGVLVVHGIGQQRRSETLNLYAGAIYEWVRDRLIGVAIGRGHRRSTREMLDKVTQFSPETVDNAAREPELDRAKARRILSYLQARPHFLSSTSDKQLPIPDDEPLMGVATLSHSSSTSENDPSTALIEMDWTDTNGADHSVQWLIAESWWAEAFPPPTFIEIIKYAPLAIPLTFLSHASGLPQGFYRRGRIYDFLKTVSLKTSFLFWANVSIFAAPLIYLLLWVTQVLTWIPIGSVQSAVLALRRVLVGVVGDAIALVNDPAVRAALVNRVERDLDWLASRCKSVLLVGHSQGAMLTFLASLTRPNNVKSLVTLGSGIRPLQALINARETRFSQLPTCFAVAHVAALGVLAAVANSFLHFMPPWIAVALGVTCFLLAISIGYVGNAIIYPVVAAYNVVEGFWRTRLSARQFFWLDLMASHDPVPGLLPSHFVLLLEGSIRIEPTFPFQEPITKVITNRRSMLADHTSYLSNREECVASLVEACASLHDSKNLSWLTPSPMATGGISFARAAIVRRTGIFRSSILLAIVILLIVLRPDLVGAIWRSVLTLPSVREATQLMWSSLKTTDIALAVVAASAILAVRAAAEYALRRLTTAVLERRNYRAELTTDNTYRLREDHSFRAYAAISAGEWSGLVISGLLPLLLLMALSPFLKEWTLVVVVFIAVLIAHFLTFYLRLLFTGRDVRRAFTPAKVTEAAKS
jgi:hypothetical protein